MSRFVLSDNAWADLQAIEEYLAANAGTSIAYRIVSDLLSGIRRVAEAPGLGHRREDLTGRPLLFYRVHSYFIDYRDTEPLGIARILHTSRDIASFLDEE